MLHVQPYAPWENLEDQVQQVFESPFTMMPLQAAGEVDYEHFELTESPRLFQVLEKCLIGPTFNAAD